MINIKVIDFETLNNFNDEYVYYACYGSNINYDRFMYYINGDQNNLYSTSDGCFDKSLPKEEKKYIFSCPIYFASNSKKWGGGFAFLDYEHSGISYGKLYKIKKSQFMDVLKQEQRCKLYDTILLVDVIDNIKVLTFTAKYKLYDLLNEPGEKYVAVIKEGLKKLYNELDDDMIDKLLKNKES